MNDYSSVPGRLRFGVVGFPVAHSKSPGMHAAAYRVLALPHTYERLETRPEELATRIDALRRGDFAGLNVTVPHKTHALALADEVDASAHATGAANTLVRTAEGRVRAHNTDTPAVADEIARLAGGRDGLRGGTALVLGTGGAARAAIVALASHLGVARVVVRGRALSDPGQATAYVTEMKAILAAGSGVTLSVEGLAPPSAEDPRLVAIVQATSCGMHGAAPGALVADAVAWASVPKATVALDVVYAPRETPFLARAKEHGLRADDGLGMLARQGALAFELWLGVPAPFDAMLDAIR